LGVSTSNFAIASFMVVRLSVAIFYSQNLKLNKAIKRFTLLSLTLIGIRSTIVDI